MINRWWDPGPCPVDDAPHTTCTSPDYVPVQPLLTAGAPVAPVVMPLQRPLALDQATVAALQQTTTVVSAPVTTKTYRRRSVPPPAGGYKVHDKGKK